MQLNWAVAVKNISTFTITDKYKTANIVYTTRLKIIFCNPNIESQEVAMNCTCPTDKWDNNCTCPGPFTPVPDRRTSAKIYP